MEDEWSIFFNVLNKFPKFVTIVIVCAMSYGTKINQHCPRTQKQFMGRRERKMQIHFDLGSLDYGD